MKFTVFVLLSFLTVVTVFADDKECKKQLKNVMECMKKKHEDNKEANEKKIEELKGKVDKCFTDAGCKAPDYSGKGGKGKDGGLAEKFKQKFEEQPESVKKCMKEEFKQLMLKKLNECLEKKGVAKINADDADDSLFEHMGGEGGHHMGGEEGHDKGDDHHDDDKKKMFTALHAVGAGLKQCKADKGDSAVEKVASCIKPLKDQIKKEMCKLKDECKKSAKVSDACQKRFDEVQKAVCECKHEKLEEAKKKVEELQAKHRDVELDEAKDIAGHDAKDFNMDKIEECYTKNNEPVPAMLTMFKNMQSGGGGKQGGLLALFKPKITQKQLQQIHDKLEEELQNKDCKMCG